MSHKTERAGLAVALMVLGGVSTPASATDYVVDTLTDVSAVDGLVSLREAIAAASGNVAVNEAPAGEASGDTITFDAAIAGGTIPLTAVLPTIADDLVITGDVTLDGQGAVQIALVDTAEPVTLTGLTLTNGVAASGGALGIAAGADVTLDTVTVSNNVGNGGTATSGGAIDNAGTLTVTGSNFTNNDASAGSGSGGAIISSGTLTVSDSSFTGNLASRAGGAIEIANGASTTLNNLTASNNEVLVSPGNGGVLHITGPVDATVNGGNFSSNTAGQEGGALWNNAGTLTVNGGTYVNNIGAGADSDDGGGALHNQGGTLIVNGATIEFNSATGAAGSGGGILNKISGRVCF